MPKTLDYNKTLGIIKSVCLSYATLEEILEYFDKFEDDKEFTQEEIKLIAKELTEGRQRRKLNGPKTYAVWEKRKKQEKDR